MLADPALSSITEHPSWRGALQFATIIAANLTLLAMMLPTRSAHPNRALFTTSAGVATPVQGMAASTALRSHMLSLHMAHQSHALPVALPIQDQGAPISVLSLPSPSLPPTVLDSIALLTVGALAVVGALSLARFLRTEQEPEAIAIAATTSEPTAPATASSAALLAACSPPDVDRIRSEIQRLARVAMAGTRSTELRKTWHALWAESYAPIGGMGAGKDLESDRRLLEAYLVLGKSKAEWLHAARRLGPYPNELQQFTGEWKAKDAGELRFAWESFVSNLSDKPLDGERRFTAKLVYVDAQALVLQVNGGLVVFEAVTDLEEQLEGLRVKRGMKGPDDKPNPVEALGNLFRPK